MSIFSGAPAQDQKNVFPARALVRLASTEEEIRQAQELRYKVFYEEYGALPSEAMKRQRRDFDDFDTVADHLIVTTGDNSSDSASGRGEIVGTYRLLRQSVAEKHGRFYTSEEYDISALLGSGHTLLELGRSCVLPEYRTQPILNLLWQGIADYVTEYEIDLMFGCASFQGTDIRLRAPQLSYLHHYHPTPEIIRPIALQERYINMNTIPAMGLNEKRVFASLPPLIKGYLRLGATIGDGAVVDKQFNTTDVCIVVQTKLVTERYRKYYERKIRRIIPGSPSSQENSA